MRVGIINDRQIDNQENYTEVLAEVFDKLGNATLILGGAPGPDTWAREFGKNNNLDSVVFLPYHKLDKSVDFTPKFFFVRNRQIISNSDVVVVFIPEEGSGNTDIGHAIDYSDKKGKEVQIYKVG